MSAAAERSLFATKGRAAPNGGIAAPPPAPANPAPATGLGTVADPAQPALPLEHGAAADAPVGEARSLQGEAAPIGSLLDFRLRRGAGLIALAEDGGAALRTSATPPHDAADRTASPTAAAASAGTPVAESAAAAAPAASEAQPSKAAPVAMPEERPAEPLSTRLDRPLFPHRPATPSVDAPKAEEPVFTPVRNSYAPPRTSMAKTVLPAAAAVVAIAVVGWLIADSEPARDPVTPDASREVASPSPVEPESGPAPADAVAVATAPSLPDATTDDPARRATPSADAAPAVPIQPETSAMAASVGAPAAPSAEIPTLDVVRVEPGAAPVLAGRAAPGAELVILDNGALLGTATADGNGEWALVSDAPLPAGRHELSLALKTPDGAVIVEQAETRSEATGGATGSPGEALLVPPAKPFRGAGGATPYVVQLASVASVGDAEREWTRLKAAYPALLGSREVEIDAAEVGGRGTFYRLRTGPFADREAARLLCRELNTAGQECLVVRAATD